MRQRARGRLCAKMCLEGASDRDSGLRLWELWGLDSGVGNSRVCGVMREGMLTCE